MIKTVVTTPPGPISPPSWGRIHLESQVPKAKWNLSLVLGGELFGLKDCYGEGEESSLGAMTLCRVSKGSWSFLRSRF